MEKKIINTLNKAGLTEEQALTMTREELLAVSGIGPKTADAILAEAAKPTEADIAAVEAELAEEAARDMPVYVGVFRVETEDDPTYWGPDGVTEDELEGLKNLVERMNQEGTPARLVEEREEEEIPDEYATPIPAELPANEEALKAPAAEEAAPTAEVAAERQPAVPNKPAEPAWLAALNARTAQAMGKSEETVAAEEVVKRTLFIGHFMNVLDEHAFDEVASNFVKATLSDDQSFNLGVPDVTPEMFKKVAIGDSQIALFLKKNGIPQEAFLKLSTSWDRKDVDIEHSVCSDDESLEAYLNEFVDPEDDQEESIARVAKAIAQAFLNKACRDKQLIVGDKKFVACGWNASENRQSESVWIEEGYKKSVIDFEYLGRWERLVGKLAMSKLMVYGGLARSTSRRFFAKYGKKLGSALMPSNIYSAVVVPDIIHVLKNVLVDWLQKNDQFSFKVRKDLEDKISDGLILHIIDDDKLKGLDLAEIKACSVRLPLMKGLMLQLTRSAWLSILEAAGAYMTTDVYGIKHDIRWIETIVFQSAFKGWQGFDSWKDYVDQLKAYDCAEWRVCVDCRHSKANFPTQQVCALLMDEDTIEAAVKYNGDKMDRYQTPEGAHELVGGKLGAIAKELPAVVTSPVGQKSFQGAWGTKAGKVLGGNFLETGTAAFVAPDVVPLIYALVGKEPKQFLDQGKITFDGFAIGHKVIMSRNPCPNVNLGIAENVAVPKEYKGLYLGGVIFFSWSDPFMLLFQMDFDGDKLNLVEVEEGTFTETIYNAVLRAVEKFDYRPLLFENNSPKKMWTEDAEYESIRTTSPAPIGIFDNAIRIVFGVWRKRYGKTVSQFYEDGTRKPESVFRKEQEEALAAAICATRVILASLEAQVTLCVDEAKNGAPERQDGESLIGDFAKQIIEDLAKDRLHKDICYAFKKVSLNNEGELEEYLKKHKFARNFDDPVGQYSLRMMMRLPEKYVCVGAPVWDPKTSWHPMSSGKHGRKIKDLFWLPEEYNTFKDTKDKGFGIFNRVMEFVKESSIRDANGNVPNRKWILEKARELFFQEVGKVAQVSADEAIDSVIMAVFSRNASGWQFAEIEEAQRMVIEMFFDDIIENIARNKGKKVEINDFVEEEESFCFHDEGADDWYED